MTAAACALCTAGHPRLWGEHVRVTERGEERMGACVAPDAAPAAKPDTFAERLAGWRERIRAMGKPVSEPEPRTVPMPLPCASEPPRAFTEVDDEDLEDERDVG